MTAAATNMSAIANEAKNRLPIRRSPLSVYIAMQTRMLPAALTNIRRERNIPEKNIIVNHQHTIYGHILNHS